jgi:three-Cys-motif partner protein
MTAAGYLVVQNSDFFEEFDDHTRLKHAILNVYLFAWAMKLLQRPGGDQVLFVDAFAGAGRDEEGNPGSPLIATRVAAAVNDKLGVARQPGRGMRVVAIEKRPRRFRTLQQTLDGFKRIDDTLAVSRKGELGDFVDGILEWVREAPVLTFLDPFGIQGLDAAVYPKLLSGPRNEVFVLFADMGAVRLHGLITAEAGDLDAQLDDIRGSPSLFPEYDQERALDAAESVESRNTALDVSQPKSREHLTRALGDESWADEVSQRPPEQRAHAFLLLFMRRLAASGARYVLAIPMRNNLRRRVYSLVHASKSAAGFVAMKEAVNSGLRRDELSAEVCRLIQQDLSVETGEVMEQVRLAFAGSTLPWSAESSDHEITVRRFVLERTPMFPFQLDELKAALKAAGYLQRFDRKLTCTFPPPSDQTPR